jgi:hypothetical protein
MNKMLIKGRHNNKHTPAFKTKPNIFVMGEERRKRKEKIFLGRS